MAGLRSPLDVEDDDDNTNAAASVLKKKVAKKTVTHHQEPPQASGEDSAGDENASDNNDRPEIKNSGQASGNPEIKNSGYTDERSDEDHGGQPTTGSYDYLGAAYGGITDPYDDFVKGSTQLPLALWRSLKAAAAVEGIPVQQLIRDIVLGWREPLPKLNPVIERQFYNMAKQGKLKR